MPKNEFTKHHYMNGIENKLCEFGDKGESHFTMGRDDSRAKGALVAQ